MGMWFPHPMKIIVFWSPVVPVLCPLVHQPQLKGVHPKIAPCFLRSFFSRPVKHATHHGANCFARCSIKSFRYRMKRSFLQGQASKKVSSSSCAESKKILRGQNWMHFWVQSENSDSYFLRDRVGFGFGCSSGRCWLLFLFRFDQTKQAGRQDRTRWKTSPARRTPHSRQGGHTKKAFRSPTVNSSGKTINKEQLGKLRADVVALRSHGGWCRLAQPIICLDPLWPGIRQVLVVVRPPSKGPKIYCLSLGIKKCSQNVPYIHIFFKSDETQKKQPKLSRHKSGA